MTYSFHLIVISNSNAFIIRIKDVKLSGESIMASLDIVSLIPSIGTNEVIRSINESIDNSHSLNDNNEWSLKAGLNSECPAMYLYSITYFTGTHCEHRWVH